MAEVNVIQWLRDQDSARSARLNYRLQARWLEGEARKQVEAGDTREARKLRYYAAIAVHAARAEFMDPQS